MASVNKAILIGNLGQDPERKSFQTGGEMCNLRIATSESWKDRDTGERKERTEWHTVSIFSEGLVRVAMEYLRKGSKVYIEGQLRTRKWQAQDGSDRYSTEVVLQGPQAKLVMLDSAGGQNGDGRGESRRGYDDRDDRRGGYGRDRDDRGGSQRGDGGGWGGNSNSSHRGWADELDDEVPF